MNIDELEKLARGAASGPWIVSADEDSDKWLVGYESQPGLVGYPVVSTYSDDDATYIAAANPAAILELISINRELVSALENYIRYTNNGVSGGEAGPAEIIIRDRAVLALARANGE